MQTIIAAGGVVVNAKNEILLIYRRKIWDLPKGKLDDGETIETCALREVQEETGVYPLTLKKFIGKTYHQYFDRWVGEEVIKETHWYFMQTNFSGQFIPQQEEDIEDIKWVSVKDLSLYLQHSFDSIKKVIWECKNQNLF
jgi:8-oxo-dGTP pyrophosphatase MutT (NUDIX family)